jgi:hypothetical protein
MVFTVVEDSLIGIPVSFMKQAGKNQGILAAAKVKQQVGMKKLI